MIPWNHNPVIAKETQHMATSVLLTVHQQLWYLIVTAKIQPYNIDAQPSAPQEPTYEVIPSEIDRIPQGAQNVNCSQNPAYIHLGVQMEESFQAAADGDYSQNPAYGIRALKS